MFANFDQKRIESARCEIQSFFLVSIKCYQYHFYKILKIAQHCKKFQDFSQAESTWALFEPNGGEYLLNMIILTTSTNIMLRKL